MRIGGFLPTTLLDYPEHLACTVFTQGCNLRCPYCQNSGLVLPECFEPPLDTEAVLARIKKRSSLLEGVCISGGEPTLQGDLEDFILRIREMGLRVKLDTNGSRPDILASLLEKGLLDMVAMDVKAAPVSYPLVCGIPELDYTPFQDSIKLLLETSVPYEFRTTLVKGLHTLSDMEELSLSLLGASAYFLQSYEESSLILAHIFTNNTENSPTMESFTPAELSQFLQIAQKHVPQAKLRGIELPPD